MRAWIGSLLLLVACSTPGPREVVVGTDLCEHCHMTVVDPRFVSQLVTTTGKVLIFDDAGCLATALNDGVVAGPQVRSLWVTDFLAPAALLEAEAAWFVRAPSLNTPMASGLAAVPTSVQADSLAVALGGEVLRWAAVRTTPHGH
ncbi:MAG: nitrous oxide reductase accessory protein NosL [Gemmatimonadota bacterium]|nr:nitrous oxide reductase accessory protein NosL [Gemmatimonadota bacterium]